MNEDVNKLYFPSCNALHIEVYGAYKAGPRKVKPTYRKVARDFGILSKYLIKTHYDDETDTLYIFVTNFVDEYKGVSFLDACMDALKAEGIDAALVYKGAQVNLAF